MAGDGRDLTALFEHTIDFDPGAGVEAIALDVPAAWCVYLLADVDGQPVQLLCVKNLRASLRRRLAVSDEPTRRADLTQVVRRVAWTRVDSAYEQDLTYLEAARACFPESYAGVLGFYPAWFLHLNPDTTYPRLTRQNQIDKQTGVYVGPLPDKHAADKLVRAVEDTFDLCRDWERLTSDKSDPCQWRQMGKCVGPCEGPPGGVSLDAYRGLVAEAAAAMCDPAGVASALEQRMRAAAAEQRFEDAASIKKHAENVAALGEGNRRHARPIEQFRFLAVLPGGDGFAKVFAITPTRSRFVAAVPADGDKTLREAVLSASRDLLAEVESRPSATDEFERVSLATLHLFAPKKQPGVWLHTSELTDRKFAAAVASATKPAAEAASDNEGEVRGLQSI